MLMFELIFELSAVQSEIFWSPADTKDRNGHTDKLRAASPWERSTQQIIINLENYAEIFAVWSRACDCTSMHLHSDVLATS